MSKKIKYQFIAFPTHLDTYGFLNEDEKSVLRCLIRLGRHGWFYGDKKLAKNLNVGVYHLRRAKLRLHLLGLLIIERRGSQNFTYYFQDEIENWRLTEKINAKLQVDCEKMSQGRIEFRKEPFKSDDHFDKYFAQTFPKFARGRKGRGKDEDTESADVFDPSDATTLKIPYRPPVSRFKALIDKVETVHPTKLLSDFFNYRPRIDEMKYGDNKITDPSEIEYLGKLDAKADKLMREPDPKLKLILDEVLFKVQQGESSFDLSLYLDSVYRNQIKTEAKGGQNEI